MFPFRAKYSSGADLPKARVSLLTGYKTTQLIFADYPFNSRLTKRIVVAGKPDFGLVRRACLDERHFLFNDHVCHLWDVW